MANDRVVSKKELEESGLSLRDFLNKERGLTRKPPEGTKFGVNVDRPTKEARAAMNAQDNANRGLDENGRPLQEQAYKSRAYNGGAGRGGQGGMSSMDADEAGRRDKTMAAYKSRAYNGGAGRGGQGGMSSMDADEAGRRDKTMDEYTPRRDANAAARARLSSGEGDEAGNAMKRGGTVKKMAKGGSASSRADGIAQRGKTKGRMC
jgi:hypothetical protein